MGAYKLASPRRAILAPVAVIVVILIFLTSNAYRPLSEENGVPEPAPAGMQTEIPEDDAPQSLDSLSFPADYSPASDEPSFCAERFEVPYLENLRDSATRYCTEQSGSQLTCFHSKTAGSRTDTFCLGQNAIFDTASRKFMLQCELGEPSPSKSSFRAPEFNQFPSYWYETGPRVIFNDWVEMSAEALPTAAPQPRAFTILVKREMHHNFWHSLMEIFSMAMSIDVLRITSQPDSSRSGPGKRPLLSDAEMENIQVVLLDDLEDGAFIDLWPLLSSKPVVRAQDLPEDSALQNIVVPLPGGSNPFWQGDWTIHGCEDSALLRTFSRRVLSFYGLPSTKPRQDSQIMLTFINRTNKRRLVNSDEFLAELESKYPHVTVHSYDFAALTMKRQLEIVQDTDILVGVHGAGLTHGFFLHPRSAMVEILPPKLNHKGFRNVASLMNLGHYSAHADDAPRGNGNWQDEDISMDKERFMALIDAAIKSMYGKGKWDYDIV
ncbi:uncharacterized protein APUU_50174S [Aspergillus puulaauensis]|uniref:EGF domain-specific O-linked N-acetylglucosamine transferase n=1 Tax=Aspergillus puulaauensis TaxID=1220207 RepID=A0A7R8AQ38_9EURO|nr:uncharacterized protein APUU_50174S [Aspergillus puulaauensis]BCS25463.1 hypothetical protein APUU_50174S [Aspergillus puulaauensis]